MSDIIETNIDLISGTAKFLAASRDNPELIIDFFPPVGSAKGYTSQELLLLSLSSCLSTTLRTFMENKLNKTVKSISAKSRGFLRETHPKSLSQINMHIKLTSPDLSTHEVDLALNVCLGKLCPVCDMIKGNTNLNVTFDLIDN